MQENKSTSQVRCMVRDASPFSLREGEFSFALNTLGESESGDSYNLKNETSNLLNITFPDGFRVVGHINQISKDRTHFLLTNPDSKVSKIGYIENSTRGVNEEELLVAYSNFVELLEDSCNLCLNLHIDFPVKKIALKEEKLGDTLYWADNRNPDRHLNLDKIESYKTTGQEVCGDDSNVQATCLDCDKLRIDKKHILPTVVPVSIESGGQLEKGVYEFAITYSDKLGNEISEYVSLTNPVHIFDNNNKVIPETEISERTNQAIKLRVDNLDPQYKYYKLIIVQKLLGSVSYFEEGIHPINDKEIVISTVQDKTRTDINKLLAQKTSYVKSEGVTSSNGYLFRYGLTAEKEWNLQPISNLLGAFVRWQTVEAKEDIYSRGEASSLYKGYYRDEVYPLGIRFETSTGYKTALFPLISRPAESYIDDRGKIVDENQTVDNKDTQSVNALNPNCSTEERNKFWQFYNTAHDVKRATNFSGETTIVTQTVDKYCINENFSSIENGKIFLDISALDNFTTLKAYIEEFGNELSKGLPSDILSNYDNEAVEDILTDIREDVNCEPYLKENCSGLELVNSTILLGEVEGEDVKLNPKSSEDYAGSRISRNNFIHKVNEEGRGKRNQDFIDSYLTDEAYPFEREITVEAESCPLAIELNQRTERNETSLGYVTQYYGATTREGLETIVFAQPSTDFQDRIHKGAIWFKSKIKHGDKAFIELPSWREAQFDDLFSDARSQGTQPTLGNHKVRVSVYTGRCSNLTLLQTHILDVREDHFLHENPILKESLINDEFYVVVDVPIKSVQNGYVTAVVNGSIALEVRAEEYESAEISFSKLSVNKQQKYNLDCEFEVPVFNECEPQPYKNGKFSYWESSVNYPDNKELYDSSGLKVEAEDIDDSIKNEFKKYFVAGAVDNKYLLKEATNFVCKPIRHFKFPDFNTAPFMSTNLVTPFSQTYVYPLGVTVDKNVVNNFLNIAVKNKLISQEQRDSITGFEIFRGDRRVNKSILGKGLAYDIYEYDEKVSGDKTLFSNFPFNDLGDNTLLYNDEERENYIEHPYSGNRNSRFSLHSPDFDFYDVNIGQEAKVEAYQYGNSRGKFSAVEDHPEWVILGDKSYRTANKLALLEYALEAAIRLVENTIQSSQNYWFLVGVSSGGNPAGAVTSSVATGIFTAFDILTNAVPVIGRYRYEWLKIFRDLGKPENFAYQYAAEGFYNFAEPNNWYDGLTANYQGNTLRAVSTGKYLREGKFIFTEKDGEQLRVNNLDREKSIFLTFGKDYPIEYPTSYKTFDNNTLDSYRSSRTIQSATGECTKGTSAELQKNIASPYVSLKNYVPFQYNDISSIKWLKASNTIHLDDNTDDYAVFGGDIFISRYTLKRKVPLFTPNAFGLAPLTPYEYYKNSNIGYAKFYADYELGGEESLEDVLFPDFKSEYVFDCQTSKSGSYIKAPSKFYLYYYGISNFLVESEINLNLRYGKPDPKDNFYPEVGDYSDWVQQKNVSIREPNKLFYNNVYSSSITQSAYRTLPDYYSKKEFDTIYDSPNGVIYSMQDTSENDLTDPWLIYKPLDYYQFPSSYGKLIDLRGIESAQVLGRFENTSVIFNAVNQYKDAQDAASRELGTGGIFAARPMEFSNTELGYGGSQTYQLVSNEFGHFYPDAEKGQVFQASAKSLQEISSIANGNPVGMKAWFKEHLPFKIKNSLVENYADIDTDNALNGIGITMGWDSKFDRVLLTKVDYVPLQEMYYCGGSFLDMDCNPIEYCRFENKEQTIQQKLSEGFKYIEEDCKLIFQKYTEECTYSFIFCDYTSKEPEITELVNQGYSLDSEEDCQQIYIKTEESCDPNSKQTEIQALLDQGYISYSPTDCSYTAVQSQINSLISQGYTQVSDTNCVKTFQKTSIDCDLNSKQSEIQALLDQGFVQVGQNGCDLIFERNTDLSAISNGDSTATGELIDIQGQVDWIEGNSNGDAIAELDLTEVTPPLLQGISTGTSTASLQLIDIQPNTFIGGVASEIPNAQVLANKLNSSDGSFPVTEADIYSFNIVGNDIEAHVSINYIIDNQRFQYYENITYYNDAGNKCVELHSAAFQLASNLQYAYFNGCLNIQGYQFSYCTSLIDIQFNALQTITGLYIINRTLLQEVNFPNLTSISAPAFASEINPANQTRINIPKCTTIGTSTGNTNVFLNIRSGCEIICPISLQTANAGAEDGDIAYARSRGAIITYV